MASIATLVTAVFDSSNSSTYGVTNATYTAGRLYIMTIRNRRTAGASESPSSISGGNASNVWTIPTNGIELTYQTSNNRLTTWFMQCAVTETVALTINFTNTHLNCSYHVAECIDFDPTVNSVVVQQNEVPDDTNTNASLAFGSAFLSSANYTYAVMDYAATGTAQSITADGNMTELANPEASGIEVGYLHVQYKASEEATVNWTKSNSTASGMGIMELRLKVSATVTGVTATATADAHAGVITAVRTTSVSGETATASAVAHEGVVTTAAPADATVAGAVATATADALAGVITATIAATISGATATATATAHEGAITAIRIVAVVGETATATATAPAGSIAAVRTTSVTGETATATAVAYEGEVTDVIPSPATGGIPDLFRPRDNSLFPRQVVQLERGGDPFPGTAPELLPSRGVDLF